MYKKKELQLSYFSICEGKKLDDKIVTYFALKTGSTVHVLLNFFMMNKKASQFLLFGLRYHNVVYVCFYR